MPDVRQPSDDVIAIAVADLHFSERPPIARSAEPDWYEAMGRPIAQIKALEQKYKVPVLVAGDIFDGEASPKLINWVIRNFRFHTCVAIAGNHDLPGHDINKQSDSAFGTLVEAQIIQALVPGSNTAVLGCLSVTGFPYGVPLYGCRERKHDFYINVALVHKFVWQEGCGFPGAPQSSHITNVMQQLEGYDVVLFGDNHKGFVSGNAVNCGGLFRRRRDEQDYRPQITLIHRFGKITRVPVDVSRDRFVEPSALERLEQTSDSEMLKVVKSIGELGYVSCDFKEALKRRLEKVKDTGTKAKVLEALEVASEKSS